MNTVQKIAVAYILCLTLLAFGFAVGKYEIFPYQYIQKIEDFVAWDSDAKDTSIQDKLQNEMGIKPTLFLYPFPPSPVSLENTSDLTLPNANKRRENPKIYIAPEHQSGYRAIFGVMDFDDSFWGGILISPESEVIHTWKLSTDHLPLSKKPDHLKNMYGLELLPDGSVIYTMQEDGGGIVKVDACGKVLWYLEGLYHHTISMSDDNKYFWSYMGRQESKHHKLVKVSSSTGKIVKTINMRDVFLKNEFIHIWDFRNKVETIADQLEVSHGNDIDELQVSQAHEFPGFKAGDLLLSYRNLNLIFVIDQETLDVKWWRIGATDRQHDPDWEKGAITAFSNNTVGARKGHSDIVRIDVDTMQHTTLVDGEKYSMFSFINARQNLTAFDTRIMTSSTQGWILEVDDNDKLVFSFLNTYDSELGSSLHLSEAFRVKPSYFTRKFWESCES